MASRAYKTLPSAFRRDTDRKRGPRSSSDNHRVSSNQRSDAKRSAVGSPDAQHQQSGLFGLNLNLGISNFISGGINFFGHLRRKTPSSTTPTSSSASPPNHTIFGTASKTEFIELTSFGSIPKAEGDYKVQMGKGHDFFVLSTFNPTWCDLCRDLIWGLYDNGAVRCTHCHLICHEKCRGKVRLNCTSFERSPIASDKSSSPSSKSSSTSSSDDDVLDESTLANISTLRDEIVDVESDSSDERDGDENCPTLKDLDDELTHDDDDEISSEDESFSTEGGATLTNNKVYTADGESEQPEKVNKAIATYNELFPLGQETIVDESTGLCKGFIRVALNLSRPINVLPGTQPPSVYNITCSDVTSLGAGDKSRTLTSFYLPPETEKALHVTTATTTRDVIRSLLAKFRIVDSPHKYALYEKTPSSSRRPSADQQQSVTVSGTARSRATLGRVAMRRMGDEERPLALALSNSLVGVDSNSSTAAAATPDVVKSLFVLQENDPGDICWDSFSMPELKNFLLILDREEAWYKKRIHEKYELIHEHMKQLAEQKKAEREESRHKKKKSK